MAYKTLYTPTHPEKYVGDPRRIVCRSSWERGFAKYCDLTPGVVAWSSEELRIPYISPIDGRIHGYWPDFIMTVKSKDGGLKKLVVEIKPAHQTNVPQPRSRKTRKYLTEVATFAVNQAKWQAAKEFCEQQGMSFLVLTERELFKRVS